MAMIEIMIDTTGPSEAIDITSRVERALQGDGINTGIAVVSSLHTTTGLAVNENDPALMEDIMSLLEQIVPKSGKYLHNRGDGNAHAHIRSVLTGNSVTIPVDEGRLVLGTWQRILFFEFDGPRKRRVYVQTISNKMK